MKQIINNRWNKSFPYDSTDYWSEEHNDLPLDEVIKNIFENTQENYMVWYQKYYVEMAGNTWFNAIPFSRLSDIVEKYADCVGHGMTLGKLRSILSEDVGEDPEDWNRYWFSMRDIGTKITKHG